MRRRTATALLAAVPFLFATACDDTLQGAEEDLEQGVEDVQEEIQEGDAGQET